MLFGRFPDMTLADPESVVWRGFGFRGAVELAGLVEIANC